MAFDRKLLDVIACPVCKGKLQFVKEQEALVCRFDRLSFPIREGIPALIEEEADTLSLEQLEALK